MLGGLKISARWRRPERDEESDNLSAELARLGLGCTGLDDGSLARLTFSDLRPHCEILGF